MTSSEDTNSGPRQAPTEQALSQILEVLDRLGAGENFASVAAATGIGEEEVRGSLRRASEIVRRATGEQAVKKRWPVRGSILDWREMTVAEALEILSDQAVKIDAPPDPM